jgi:hypothetical protein
MTVIGGDMADAMVEAMGAKVMVATSVGPGKEYAYPFLWKTMEALAGKGKCDYLTVFDGVELPPGVPGYRFKMDPAPDDMPKVDRISRVREATRIWFLDHPEYSHLYFHDCDVIPPLDIIPRLLMEPGQIASGLCPLRGWGDIGVPIVSLSLDGREAEMFGVQHLQGDVVAVGMACCLIERSVLERTPFRQGEALGGVSEDFKFCLDAGQNCGAFISLDPSCACWHVDHNGLAGRLTVGEKEFGAVYEDSPAFVNNKFGAWKAGTPRFDLTFAQMAELGPGWTVAEMEPVTLEVRPVAEVINEVFPAGKRSRRRRA